MRLIAFSIIILSGALMHGLGGVGRNSDAAGVGMVVLLLGFALLAGELYLTQFFRDLRRAFSGKSAPEDPPGDSPPPAS
jgi:hypothetical protein